MKTGRVRLIVVDDHTIFREGLVSLLKQQPDFEVVGEAGLASEAVDKALTLKPDMVLMDIALPDSTGFEATRKIMSLLPETTVVILTILESDEMLFEAFHSGARGYMLKNTSISKLMASLRGLLQGEAAISRKLTTRVLEEFYRIGKIKYHEEVHSEDLTHRELEVLEYMGAGASNLQIAQQLVISENTVKNHVHNILHKLKLKSRHEAAGFALRQKINNHITEKFIYQLVPFLFLINQLVLD
ncbi:MAG: response regulator transcription factor [Bellilinea sp.]